MPIKCGHNFAEGLHQLLGYPCWRYTKAAFILFNRQRDLLHVLEAIREAAVLTLTSNVNSRNCQRQPTPTSFPTMTTATAKYF